MKDEFASIIKVRMRKTNKITLNKSKRSTTMQMKPRQIGARDDVIEAPFGCQKIKREFEIKLIKGCKNCGEFP